jgi:hypothetical protein
MVRASRSVGRLVGLMVVGFALVACPPKPQPEDPDVGPPPDDTSAALCPDACARWTEMECEEGEPVCDRYAEPTTTCLEWLPCVEWCTEFQAASPQPLNLGCIVETKAGSCTELENACAY